MPRPAVIAAAIAVAVAFTLLARVITSGQHALERGNRAMARGETQLAKTWWRRAARCYVPIAPHVTQAYDRLNKLALDAETDGDVPLALDSWRAIRGSILATRTFWLPEGDRLGVANAHIARLMANSERRSPDSLGDREQWHRMRLASTAFPHPLWTLLAGFGLCVWIGFAVRLTWAGVGADDRASRRVALTAGICIALGLVIWLVALSNA